MKHPYIVSVVLVLCVAVTAVAQEAAPMGKLLTRYYSSMAGGEQVPLWVYFKDKGDGAEQKLTLSPATYLSQKAIERRRQILGADQVLGVEDLPLERSYVAGVTRLVSSVRNEITWFNAITVSATKAQIDELRMLPYVREVELVVRYKPHELLHPISVLDQRPVTAPLHTDAPLDLNYGPSLAQNQQINVVAVHNLGFSGAGVIVAIFDAGFANIATHPALQRNIIARYDFSTNSGTLASHFHGQATFSLVGGYDPGNMIGPAYGAAFALARTEVDPTETPTEEDNWARAVIWADSLGANVISSSLGYGGPTDPYDPPWPSYTWQDFDGNTAPVTRAANRATQLGIVVVNAAGNDGQPSLPQNSLGAPADGFDVITAGAVDVSGTLASFSSVGPTADGRIKPDIVALGSGDYIASGATGYSYGSGTSYATPLSAGVAALVLNANPGLTPKQVREAMRQTANSASSPSRYYGWGLLNALNAINYAWIDHTPLGNTEDTTARTVIAKIRSRVSLVMDSTRVVYGNNGSFTNSVPLTATGNPNEYSAHIPYLGRGVNVTYYITTKNANVSNRLPLGTASFSYQVGPDATGPAITHRPIGNVAISSWPPRLTATVTDQSGVNTVRIEYSQNGVSQTPVVLTTADSVYTDTLHISRSQIHSGDSIAYRIAAIDRSHLANTTYLPASGYYKFAVSNFDNASSDFEAANGGFTGTNDWQYGTPSGRSPAAHSGTKLWGTILAGNYTQGPRLSSLTTPTYTVFSNRAQFAFYHWYEAKSRFDGGNVKVSINGGAFQIVRPVGNYPNDTIYAGLSNPLAGQPAYANVMGTSWSKATFDLTGIAAEGNTLALRFDFGADNTAIVYRGWYIDDFAADGFGTPHTTGVGETARQPLVFALEQNYPNPFNPSTTISFQIPSPGSVSLKLFDILGREVATLVNESMQAGNHHVTFNAAGLASGTYFYRLQSGANFAVRKLVLLK